VRVGLADWVGAAGCIATIVRPGDGADNDCDGRVDEERSFCDAVLDADGDRQAAPEDCDDTDPSVHPGADDVRGARICGPTASDGIDNDCDGRVDEQPVTCEGDAGLDVDRDTYLPPSDCDDFDPAVHPGTQDGCPGRPPPNGRDEDCDGRVDEGGTDCRDSA
jgi:hypothetical protein